MTYNAAVEIIETSNFSRRVSDYLTDEQYMELQLYLAVEPRAGVVIPKSGGCRKLRWRGSGRGKRGGYRIIYYYQDREGKIWLFTIYSKNEAEDIPRSMFKKWKEEIEK